jgi:hypothetical protein
MIKINKVKGFNKISLFYLQKDFKIKKLKELRKLRKGIFFLED